METLSRYDNVSIVRTKLDPIQDVLCWIGGLRSKGYVERILRDIHGYKIKSSIEPRALSISRHAETAVNLLNQGLNGPVETSFLPIYYGLLNLSKIYIICSKNYIKLKQRHNRKHGAEHRPHHGRPRYFMKDRVLLKKRGAIPLLYNTITGFDIPSKEYVVELKDVYPYIVDVSFEHNFLHSERRLQICQFGIERNDAAGHFLRASFLSDQIKGCQNKSINQSLFGLSKEISDGTFRSPRIIGNYDLVSKQLKNNFRRYLLYDYIDNDNLYSYVPLSSKQLLLPEEIPLILAFFHLSNIVRYNPDLLFELMDSQEWSMIQALSRHGALRFMTLFWSYFQKTSVGFSY
ncbi:MAG: hypothetical protein ACD_61C00282G0016 [uncultured bacterium]|nr:MAG: hypothetical protein ACD_61C00282G0016 [uncultured bacterium]